MKYGFFDDINREYVITTPKTPYPWINYLGNEDYFALMSNTSGGYSFYKDALLRRITRYRYNNVPVDNNGKYFYIYDEGDVWTPGQMPVKTELDGYECRHGQGYSKITGSKGGITATQLSFVPLSFDGEIHQIKIRNDSGKRKSIVLTSYVEFCLWNAMDDMTNFQRNYNIGEVEISGSTIFHKTEYRERRDHYAFFSVNRDIDGFDTDRESFMGLYNGPDSPETVMSGKASNSIADGWHPIASHSLCLTPDNGEEISLIFILGYVENGGREDSKWETKGVINKTAAERMIKQYSSDADVDRGLAELKSYYDNLLSKYHLDSDDEKLNRMVNIWNPYQCMVTFNMSRSASYFESGIGRGMGFRDSNQDLLGFMHQIPECARERILDIAATQFEDGGAYHQYRPLTKKGNHEIGSGFNDDPLWLIAGVAAYIKETGDVKILDEDVPFDCNPDNSASLFEHLKRSFYYTVNNTGPHGLPLIGRADWNDCLNLNCFSDTPDESFQTTGNPDGRIAESIFIAGLFVCYGTDYVKMCRLKGFDAEAEKAQKHIDSMYQTVMDYGCDPNWFLRAYDHYGTKVGSIENDEGKIYIEPQGFCVMAGIGVKEGFARKALDSVKERLDTEYGIILQDPPYSEYHLELGEISSYPPGYKENSGIFCHNNPWIAIAETEIGRGDRAFEIYSKIAPAYLEEISDVHRTEPYVYSQMIAGKDARRHGEAKNSWLTGTASWNFVAISQAILGIKPDYNGLIIDPCIPSKWSGYTVTRYFRGAVYEITVSNPCGCSKGVKSMLADGREVEGNIIPLVEPGKTCVVEVLMG